MIIYSFQDYLTQAQKRLGPGWAFQGPAIRNWVAPYLQSFYKIYLDAMDLLVDIFPATSENFIVEWQRTLGIPRCDEPMLTDLTQQQNQIVSRLVQTGGQSIPYFKSVSLALGYPLLFQEFYPATCTGTCVQEIFSENSMYYFAAVSSEHIVVTSATCVGECTQQLKSWGSELLQCTMDHIWPAEAVPIWVYLPEISVANATGLHAPPHANGVPGPVVNIIWTDEFGSYAPNMPITAPWFDVNHAIVNLTGAEGPPPLAVGNGGINGGCTRLMGNTADWLRMSFDFWGTDPTIGIRGDNWSIASIGFAPSNVILQYDQFAGHGVPGNVTFRVYDADNTHIGNCGITAAFTHQIVLETKISNTSNGYVSVVSDGLEIFRMNGATTTSDPLTRMPNSVLLSSQSVGASPFAEAYIGNLEIATLGPPLPPAPIHEVAKFKVELTSPFLFPPTCNYTTVNGSAVAGTDYIANSGVLLFDNGVTEKTISVTVTLDTVAKEFSMQLSNTDNCLFGIDNAICIIPPNGR